MIAAGYDLKIGQRIVLYIPIFVMDNFVVCEFSAKRAFHEQSVFCPVADIPITMRTNPTFAAILKKAVHGSAPTLAMIVAIA